MSSFGMLAAGIFFFILIMWVRRNEEADGIDDQSGFLSMRRPSDFGKPKRDNTSANSLPQPANGRRMSEKPATTAAAAETVDFFDPDEEIEIKDPLPF